MQSLRLGLRGRLGPSLVTQTKLGLTKVGAVALGGQLSSNWQLLPNPEVTLGLGGVRTKVLRFREKYARKDPEGINYHGFTYFPRFPGQKDPPYQPSKLLRVKRVAKIGGLPYWDRDILRRFNLEEHLSTVAIVANTPSNNRSLYKIKHLIEIQPITFPHGFPTEPSQGFLKENGEYVAYNKLESPPIDVEQGEKAVNELRRKNVDTKTLRNRLHVKWAQRN